MHPFHVIFALLAFPLGTAVGAETSAPTSAEFFANDSRSFSQTAKAVVLTDLSKAEPAAALITGKRPTGPMVFGRFQQFTNKGVWPGAKPKTPPARSGDVVDVEVRDITPGKPPP